MGRVSTVQGHNVSGWYICARLTHDIFSSIDTSVSGLANADTQRSLFVNSISGTDQDHRTMSLHARYATHYNADGRY